MSAGTSVHARLIEWPVYYLLPPYIAHPGRLAAFIIVRTACPDPMRTSVSWSPARRTMTFAT